MYIETGLIEKEADSIERRLGGVNSEEEALALLDRQVFPIIKGGRIKRVDLAGKDAMDTEDYSLAISLKVLAAMNYVRVGELENAAYCYDRAAKAAKKLGFNMARIRLNIRACRLYFVLKKRGVPEAMENLRFAQSKVLRAVRSYNRAEEEILRRAGNS